MGKFIDLTGRRYGMLIVLEFAHKNKFNQSMWLCKCDCGNETIIHSNNLRRGYTKSCGCIRNNKSSERAKKHGMHSSNLYKRWKSMKERCEDLNNPNYGGRGIKVCDEWKKDFKAFYDWSMANGYESKLQIDRKDNDGNYEPSNCRWVTPKRNSENRSNVYKIKVTSNKGVQICNSITEASKSCGISISAICRALKGIKIKDKGYSFERLKE